MTLRELLADEVKHYHDEFRRFAHCYACALEGTMLTVYAAGQRKGREDGVRIANETTNEYLCLWEIDKDPSFRHMGNGADIVAAAIAALPAPVPSLDEEVGE